MILVRSKKELAVLLSKLESVEGNMKLEHYQTDSETAADWLWKAYMKGDIAGKDISDFGCGNGILGIGTLLLGAKRCLFIDKSEGYLDTVRRNLSLIEEISGVEDGLISKKAEFLSEDIAKVRVRTDIVIMNPPFGTKIRHADKGFLEIAFNSANVVYSMHKAETERFVEVISRDHGFDITESWEYDFLIKAVYKGHKKPVKKVKVRVYRMAKLFN